MKRSIIGFAVLFVTSAGFSGITFDDIEFWVGEGTNQAALVIDWNDGPSELVKVWGYRWEGTVTGADMVQAVCRADASLYTMGSLGGFGFAIGGLGYDRNENGLFDITKTSEVSSFDTDGYMSVSDYAFDGWSATEAEDVWAGGWESDGFWGYSYIEPGTDTWISSMVGASGRTLNNGTWDGWSWGVAPGWYGGDPSVTVAVPEPVTFVLIGTGAFFVRKRK